MKQVMGWLVAIGALVLLLAVSCTNHRDQLCGQKWPGSHWRQATDGQMHCVDANRNPLGEP